MISTNKNSFNQCQMYQFFKLIYYKYKYEISEDKIQADVSGNYIYLLLNRKSKGSLISIKKCNFSCLKSS